MGAASFRHVSIGGKKLPQDIQVLVEELAKAPSLVLMATVKLRDDITAKPSALMIPKENIKLDNLMHKFPASEDDGFLLLSGLSATEGKSIVQLIRIADGQVIAKWIPDWIEIGRQITSHRFGVKGDTRNFRAFHPLLLSDGSLIFNTNSSLTRLPLCSSKPLWVMSYPYHHSIELSPEGNSVWIPSVTEVFTTENKAIRYKMRDDSLSEVSLDGRIIQNLSFSKILTDNKMTAHMIGSTGFTVNLDPLHINQITPATSNGAYWQRNDLLISARHTSTVYLYRPKTGKIIWHQQGPWLNQHSAHFINTSKIAIFGNDVYGNYPELSFVYKEDHNQIYTYDFKTNTTQKLHPDTIDGLKPRTITEGRVRVLNDSSIFIEDTNNARLFRLNSKGQLVWSYLNSYDANHLGVVSWSRYLTRKELQDTVNIEHLKCDKI